jgi:molybdate transport system substrate-binding protein
MYIFSCLAAAVFIGCQGAQQSGQQGSAAKQEKIYIYVPCGMREPFDRAIRMFNEKHPGIPVQAYYDNAVVLVRKIKGGDRPDLVVSPGEVEMKALVEAGPVDAATVTDIGTYTLALVAPSDNPAGVSGLQDLTKPSVKSIAIAEPTENSVGYYAKQSLESLGIWEKVKGKIVHPEHALDVVTFSAMSKVHAALAYETCPLQSAPEKASKDSVKVVSVVPAESHSPIIVRAGMLKESPNPERSKAFLKFLLSEEVQAEFQASGLPRISNLQPSTCPAVE